MSVATEQFQYVQELVRERCAIVLREDKGYLVESRLAPIAHSLGMDGADAVLRRLRASRDSHLEQQVLEAMTTNETSWFRDLRPFNALRDCVLPDVLRQKHTDKRLCIWSAACSSGQELYSVAMLLEEHFPLLQHGWDVQLIGTDFNSEMVRRATSATFSTVEVNRGLPASLLVRYFDQEGANWRVSSKLRQRVHFMRMNLVGMWPALPIFDIVLLRNVLIYFDLGTKRRVLARTARQMGVGSALFLGGAETTTGLCDELEAVSSGGSTFYRLKRGDR
ncbi:MAG TPA: protein-glutamate O-methyltransferase CheR [Acidimicrobiales bacterium]|nr:protein-glutamate O-methyltransferase CheR [Acidimicrobiales bacterium]